MLIGTLLCTVSSRPAHSSRHSTQSNIASPHSAGESKGKSYPQPETLQSSLPQKHTSARSSTHEANSSSPQPAKTRSFISPGSTASGPTSDHSDFSSHTSHSADVTPSSPTTPPSSPASQPSSFTAGAASRGGSSATGDSPPFGSGSPVSQGPNTSANVAAGGSSDPAQEGNQLRSNGYRIEVEAAQTQEDGSSALELAISPDESATPQRTHRGYTHEEEMFRLKWGVRAYQQAQALATSVANGN